MYAQNIDLHLHAADGASGETPGNLFIHLFFCNFVFANMYQKKSKKDQIRSSCHCFCILAVFKVSHEVDS